MTPEEAQTELRYWLEVLKDGNETLDDLKSINESVSAMLDTVTKLIGWAISDPRFADAADALMEWIEAIQAKLESSIKRQEQTGRLIDGRMTMLKSELGLP